MAGLVSLMDQLTSEDRGTFRVQTKHSSYDITLDSSGDKLVRLGDVMLAGRSEHRLDGNPLPLLHIATCRVGTSAMFLVVMPDERPNPDYGYTTKTTTRVTSIERIAA